MSQLGRYSILATDLISLTGRNSVKGSIFSFSAAFNKEGVLKVFSGTGATGGLFPKILLLVTKVDGSGSIGTSGSRRTLQVFHRWLSSVSTTCPPGTSRAGPKYIAGPHFGSKSLASTP